MTTSPNISKISFYGILVIAIFIGGFILWATLFPLESAAIAPGQIVVAGNRRVVQHLEGGIIKKIYVKDGEHVKKNQLLIKLESVRSEATALVNENSVIELLGAQARIQAEINGQKQISYPKLLTQSDNPKAKQVMHLQNAILEINQKNYINKISILEQRIHQLSEQIRGKKAQLAANRKEQEYYESELKDIEVLAQKRLIKRSRMLALQREQTYKAGLQGELQATIAELDQKVGETKLHIISEISQRKKDLLAELKDVQTKLDDHLEELKTSRDVLARTEIRAPIAGTIFNLNVHTVGGVIKPGEPLMEIVPYQEEVIISARLSPLDIDSVHKGLYAKIMLSSLSHRNTPALLGKVIDVSADAIFDQNSNRYHYAVTIEVPAKELSKLGSQNLYPGMPAEVMIIVNKATPWEYFVTPILKSFNRAFKEP